MMQKLLQFKFKKTLDEGFTTLEVLVSIIIALAFVAVAMQSFVLGIAMKVQAQEKQRANQLIQEDLELLSDLASILAQDNNKCNPVAGGGNVAYKNGYAYDLWLDINPVGTSPGDLPTVNLLVAADGTETGKTLRLVRTQINDDTTDPSPAADAPYRTLKINYQVFELDAANNPTGDVIANRYVEIIPDAALRCP